MILIRASLMTLGFFVGGYAGVLIGVFIFCEMQDGGNFCGMVGLTTGPIGAVIGTVAGFYISRIRQSSKTPGEIR